MKITPFRTSRSRVVLAGLLALGLRVPAPAQFAEPYEPDPKAMKAFTQLLAAYRARPALEVKSALKIELRTGDIVSETREVTAEMVASQLPAGAKHGKAGRVDLNEFDCRFVDGNFVVVHERTEKKYYAESYEDTPYWTLLIDFQDIPYPHLAIFWGEDAVEDVCMQLLPESPDIVPIRVESVDSDGKPHQLITLASPNGSLTLTVDPKKQLIRSMVHEVTGGPTVQPGTVKRTTYTLSYTEHDKPLPAAEFTFEDGGYEKVDMLSALMPVPEPAAGVGPGGSLVGKPAPPLILATAEGAAVDLEELRGKVVVLDFWATWCGPCRRALPLLHEVAAWAREEALPVEIITVNVWEARDPAKNTPNQRLESVRAFWKKNGFTLPVAMDYTDEVAVAYGVQGIPATFVIRSDGVVHAQPHASVEALQADIMNALEALEAP